MILCRVKLGLNVKEKKRGISTPISTQEVGDLRVTIWFFSTEWAKFSTFPLEHSSAGIQFLHKNHWKGEELIRKSIGRKKKFPSDQQDLSFNITLHRPVQYNLFFFTIFFYKKTKCTCCSSSISQFTGANLSWITQCQVNKIYSGLCALLQHHISSRGENSSRSWAHIRGVNSLWINPIKIKISPALKQAELLAKKAKL